MDFIQTQREGSLRWSNWQSPSSFSARSCHACISVGDGTPRFQTNTGHFMPLTQVASTRVTVAIDALKLAKDEQSSKCFFCQMWVIPQLASRTLFLIILVLVRLLLLLLLLFLLKRWPKFTLIKKTKYFLWARQLLFVLGG